MVNTLVKGILRSKNSGLPDHYKNHYCIIMINKIYVFWSKYRPIHNAKGKKPLKNAHNGEKDDFPYFTQKSRNNL